jgi:hypothetical protein
MDGYSHRCSTDFEQTLLRRHLTRVNSFAIGPAVINNNNRGVFGVHESLWVRDCFWCGAACVRRISVSSYSSVQIFNKIS